MKRDKITAEKKYNIKEIKKQLSTGYFSVREIAFYWEIPYTTMRRVLKAHGLLKLKVGKNKIKKNGL